MLIQCDASGLESLSFSHKNRHRKSVFIYRCYCGNIFQALQTEIKSGHTKSCGCLRKTRTKTHGMTNTSIYQCWADMKQRCLNPKYKQYKDYGGRGIMVCDAWLRFECFYNDMWEGYDPILTLERKDNNKGYYKDNCTWTTQAEQNRNQRRHYKTEEVVLC